MPRDVIWPLYPVQVMTEPGLTALAELVEIPISWTEPAMTATSITDRFMPSPPRTALGGFPG